jgi:hypothetical protein
MQDVLSKTNGSRNSNGCATKKFHSVMYVKNILGLLTVTLDYYEVFEWRHLIFMTHPILTKNAVDTDLARNYPENTPLAVCQRKIDSKISEHLKCLFNIACYIANLINHLLTSKA